MNITNKLRHEIRSRLDGFILGCNTPGSSYLEFCVDSIIEVLRQRGATDSTTEPEPELPASEQQAPEFYIHNATKRRYMLVNDNVTMQSTNSVQDMQRMVAYLGMDGRMWVRGHGEFCERFTKEAA